MASGLEIFLKLDGIDGESADKQHAKEIDILSFSDGLSQPTAGAAGASVGRVTFMSVHFRKAVDKATVPLLLACAGSKMIKEALFSFRRTGTPSEFYKVKLSDVLVTALTQTAGAGDQYPLSFRALDIGGDRAGILDDVTLEYGKIEWEYRPLNPTGAPGVPVKGGWDFKKNSKV